MKFMLENRLTCIIFPKIHTENMMTQIWPVDDEWREYLKLCTKLNLKGPSQMQEDNCQHYVIKNKEKVIAGASIITASINNSNKRVCVSFEILVSNQKGSAKILYAIISKYVKKREGTSYMVTQALKTEKACGFWFKYMARHREADALTFMFFLIDMRYKLLEDTINVRTNF